jgi:hypothetical protein
LTSTVCVADSDCPLTNRELREKTNLADGFARRSGRNCIATYAGNDFDVEDLYIAAPAKR